MKNNNCLVCKNDFYGRNNQKYCSIACKNHHNNLKTRLIYRNGKTDSKEIDQIQSDIYSNKVRIQKISDIFQKETEIHNTEIAVLKSDYSELVEKYQLLKNDLAEIRKRYFDSRDSLEKIDKQIKLLSALGEQFAPAFKKVIENLAKTKKKED